MFKKLGHWFKQVFGLSKLDKPIIPISKLTESTSQVTTLFDSIDSPSHLVPYDENLLERSVTQWQFGDWSSLAKLDRDTLQHHPDRAKLALLTSAGHQGLGNVAEAIKHTRLAIDWGCSKKLVTQILISGVHNTLGRASAIGNQSHRATKHFERAISIGTSGGDINLLAQARINHQVSQVTNLLSTQATIQVDKLDAQALPFSDASSHFHAVLAKLHKIIEPNFYLEIGVGCGHSLALAKCKSIGIDPVVQERVPLGPNVQIITASSDEFFGVLADQWLTVPPELVLLDGMPLVDYILRALSAIEALSLPHTVVAIPGIYPRVPEEATRHRTDANWLGDLWKLPEILSTYRPDFKLLELDVEPAGLLLVTALDPKNTVFFDKRKELAPLIQQTNPPPPEILHHKVATDADDVRLTSYLQNIRATKS
jgi:hypothetical protein